VRSLAQGMIHVGSSTPAALILRSIAKQCVSKDRGVSRDHWNLLRDAAARVLRLRERV
jgi:hypothetical protein